MACYLIQLLKKKNNQFKFTLTAYFIKNIVKISSDKNIHQFRHFILRLFLRINT